MAEPGAPEPRSVRLHGRELRYRIAGEGPAVVLVHGMARSSDTWLPVLPRLAERHTVVAPDLPGHGGSAAPPGDYSLGSFATAIRDLLVGVLGIERATLVGHSFGGGVAMQLAYQNPELCERLVLVSSGGLGREVSWILRAAALPGAGRILPLLFPRAARRIGDAVVERLRGLGVRAPGAAEVWRAYASLTEPQRRAAFLQTLRAVVGPSGQRVAATDRLYLAAAIPVLIVWGSRDEILPLSHGELAHERIPGSRLAIFEGAGHFPHVEQPERFAGVLGDFLERTPPGRHDPGLMRELLLRHAS